MRPNIVLLTGLLLLAPAVVQAQTPLDLAYQALKAKDYDNAIAAFRTALAADPKALDARRDLAYTLLKIGETEGARDEFAEVTRRQPDDWRASLEYAFLCHETGQTAIARRVFDRVRQSGDAASKATAGQAFQNIDKALADGIARWSKAVARFPDQFSSRQELARLAEQRDDLALAAEQYIAAWRLRPDMRELLLDIARVWKAQGLTEQATGAWLAATRGSAPRVEETARAFLPSRFPYASEFRQALEVDPVNIPMRRELAFLLLEVGQTDAAEMEFRQIVSMAPNDLLSTAQLGFLLLPRDRKAAMTLLERVLQGNDEQLKDRVRRAIQPRQSLIDRADRSYQAGRIEEARKYYHAALEDAPTDAAVNLKLGWTYNMLHQDEEALRYFEIARKSTDSKLRSEADRAYKNLRPMLARFRTTTWVYPMFSSRWHDAFTYGQVKTELRLGRLPVRPYISARFVGDARGSIGTVNPQYLSESSFIFGVGLATRSWRGMTAWGEAGSAVRYLKRTDVGRMIPDYRGGLSFGKGFGHMLGGGEPGVFAQTTGDVVFLSRFQNDVLFYSQNRTGYTLPGPLPLQLTWSGNITGDRNRQVWANFFETGPGVRFRWKGMPKSVVWSVDFLRGWYLMPGREPYYDIRAGVWYAFSH